ncbi:hypothetical protein MSPP1_002883 [Malassezia sp. CBS 17886]|nr:hypothetical protein MSPP1_002883 [Malassezia sp. CBS 17886]
MMRAEDRNRRARLSFAYDELGRQLTSRRTRFIGSYHLQRTIGQGAYGKVRLATHRLTNTRVAVKQIPRAHVASLIREIHHHRRLHHPHVLQLFEVVESDTSIWLATELCAGGELYDYVVRRGSLTEPEARILFGQLCCAVAYVHREGIVHRDLKLENILLDAHNNIKLSDFGFTREYEPHHAMRTHCGTTAYAAPEMLAGVPYHGTEIDVWSLGVILFVLLCGYLPFDDDHEPTMQWKIIHTDPVLPASLSADAQDLLARLLHKSGALRPTMRDLLSHPWFAARALPPDAPALSQPCPDFVAMLTQPPHRPFSTPPETSLLLSLQSLGFAVGQIQHSVLTCACDSAGALWWLLYRKATEAPCVDVGMGAPAGAVPADGASAGAVPPAPLRGLSPRAVPAPYALLAPPAAPIPTGAASVRLCDGDGGALGFLRDGFPPAVSYGSGGALLHDVHTPAPLLHEPTPTPLHQKHTPTSLHDGHTPTPLHHSRGAPLRAAPPLALAAAPGDPTAPHRAEDLQGATVPQFHPQATKTRTLTTAVRSWLQRDKWRGAEYPGRGGRCRDAGHDEEGGGASPTEHTLGDAAPAARPHAAAASAQEPAPPPPPNPAKVPLRAGAAGGHTQPPSVGWRALDATPSLTHVAAHTPHPSATPAAASPRDTRLPAPIVYAPNTSSPGQQSPVALPPPSSPCFALLPPPSPRLAPPILPALLGQPTVPDMPPLRAARGEEGAVGSPPLPQLGAPSMQLPAPRMPRRTMSIASRRSSASGLAASGSLHAGTTSASAASTPNRLRHANSAGSPSSARAAPRRRAARRRGSESTVYAHRVYRRRGSSAALELPTTPKRRRSGTMSEVSDVSDSAHPSRPLSLDEHALLAMRRQLSHAPLFDGSRWSPGSDAPVVSVSIAKRSRPVFGPPREMPRADARPREQRRPSLPRNPSMGGDSDGASVLSSTAAPVFRRGDESAAAAPTLASPEPDDDWLDEDEDPLYTGGIGQADLWGSGPVGDTRRPRRGSPCPPRLRAAEFALGDGVDAPKKYDAGATTPGHRGIKVSRNISSSVIEEECDIGSLSPERGSGGGDGTTELQVELAGVEGR